MRQILLYSFSFFVAIGLFGCSRYDKHVAEALAEIARSNDSISLSELTSYEWDKVYVIGPYESFDYSAIKGVPKRVKSSIEWQELNDKSFVLLFTLNQKFISYSEVGRSPIDELGLKRASVYAPETIIPLEEEDFIMFNYKNDKRPKFDGDMSLKKLTSWIESHLNYPQELKKEGIQGRVTIIFTITKEGELTDVKVLRGVHPMLDEEAIRVIKTTAGKWTGGCNAFTGEPQDSQITCPVIFRLKP